MRFAICISMLSPMALERMTSEFEKKSGPWHGASSSMISFCWAA
jgi:hypothetical protein